MTGRLQVGRVIGERSENGGRHDKRDTESQQTIAQELRASFLLQAMPDEQTRKKEHKRHEEDVVEAREYTEPVPSLGIDNRKRLPPARLRDSRRRWWRIELV